MTVCPLFHAIISLSICPNDARLVRPSHVCIRIYLHNASIVFHARVLYTPIMHVDACVLGCLAGWLAGWLTGWSAGQPFVRFPASMPVRCLREIRVSRFSPTVIDRSRSLTRSRRPDCERPRSQLMARPPIQLCTYNGEEEEWGVERKERRKKQISSITFHLSSM